MPRLEGVALSVAGKVYETDSHGLTVIPLPRDGVYEVRLETPDVRVPGRKLSFAMWSDGNNKLAREVEVTRFVLLEIAFDESYRLNFADEGGPPLDINEVTSATFVDDRGNRHRTVPAQDPWLAATRIRDVGARFEKERIRYRLESAIVGGADAAPDPPELLEGDPISHWRVPLNLHSLSVSVTDAFLRGPSGAAISVQFPDGHIERKALRQGRAKLQGLAAGSYRIRAEGNGISRFKNVAVEGSTAASIRLLSWLDLLLVTLVASIVAAALWQLAKLPELQPRLEMLRLPRRRGRHSVRATITQEIRDDGDGDALGQPALGQREQELADLRELEFAGKRELELAEMQRNLAAARAERGAIEDQLKRVLTDLLRLQDGRTQESDARARLEGERDGLLAQAETRKSDAEHARAEAQRLRDQLEGARWSQLLQTEGASGSNELASQLEGYRRNVNQLEGELQRVRRELHEERAAKQVMRSELEKRRLQLENLSREKELVTKRLVRAEKQLELVEDIRTERDDLLAQLESQDQAGERMAASFQSLVERLSSESRGRAGRRPSRESDSGPPRGSP
ncbi:MAG: hypothetical protein M3454_08715 [Actinomycetota bacterium]|nr:hypothetical protein [Actinomycetota bacterium]